MFFRTWLSLVIFIVSSICFGITPEELKEKKEIMIKRHLKARDITSKEVLRAMREVPREEFVLTWNRELAYADRPLSIGYGQTISQPFIVAYMTELLNLQKEARVLEIGTGSGYQAAVLAEIVDEVYSIEIIEELYLKSSKLLRRLGYKNVKTSLGDGYYGWEEHAPYDAIIVTCAAKSVPPSLIRQLKIGGRICIPVGAPFSLQRLFLVTKHSKTDIRAEVISYVSFVPLVRSVD